MKTLPQIVPPTPSPQPLLNLSSNLPRILHSDISISYRKKCCVTATSTLYQTLINDQHLPRPVAPNFSKLCANFVHRLYLIVSSFHRFPYISVSHHMSDVLLLNVGHICPGNSIRT